MLSKYVTHDYRLDELKDRQTHVLITQTIDRDGYHTGYEGLTYDPDCSRKHADRVDFHRELENQLGITTGFITKKKYPKRTTMSYRLSDYKPTYPNQDTRIYSFHCRTCQRE